MKRNPNVRYDLKKVFAETIAAGLRRNSFTSCSRWSMQCRMVESATYKGPWSFKYYPWTKEMHDTDCDFVVGQKAAQMGYTEYALNRVLFSIDVRKMDAMYLLPSKTPDASNFSSGRFDTALELSPYLQNLFTNVKNVAHKRAGTTNLYIRGARSKSGLKAVPVGILVLDELEEMPPGNIPLAFERQSGQMKKQTIAISTPRVDGRGINLYFNRSTKEHFHFPCPKCGKWTELIFPECLMITGEHLDDPNLSKTHLICKECKNVLDHESKFEWLASGRWVPSHTQRAMRGFYINQLYSPTVTPYQIAEMYMRAQQNPADEQEFYNSKLGKTHAVAGARVTDEQINACIKGYILGTRPAGSTIVTMGVDQGRLLHYHVDSWVVGGGDLQASSRARCIDRGTVVDFEQLDDLMRKWFVNACVIDAQPERRMASAYAQRFPGFVWLCFYSNTVRGKSLKVTKDMSDDIVSVDRTYWLDTALGRFKNQTIALPQDIGFTYKDHIKAPIRIYETEADGTVIGRYVKADKDQDHYAHARCYSEIALNFAVQNSLAHNIKSPR